MNHIGFALAAMFLIGFSDFWVKKGINAGVDGIAIMAYTTVIMAVVLFAYAYFQHVQLKISSELVKYAGVNGSLIALGSIAIMIALGKGDASVVFSIGRLSLIVTVIFAFVFLKESITTERIIGIILALLAIYFLAK